MTRARPLTRRAVPAHAAPSTGQLLGPDGPVALVRRSLVFVDPGARRRLRQNVPISVGLAIFEFATMLLLVTFLDAAASGDDMAERFDWAVSLGVPAGSVTLSVGLTVAILFVAKSLLGAWVMWWQFGVATRAGATRSVDTFHAFLTASLRFHARSDSSTGLRDIRMIPYTVVRSILIPAIGLVTDTLMFGALAALLLVSDPLTGGVALGYLILVGLGYAVIFGGRLREVNAEMQDLTRQAFARLQDGILGAESIQSAQAEDYFIGRTSEVRYEWAKARQRAGFLIRAPRFYIEVALVLGITLICVLLFATNETSEAFAMVAVIVVVLFRLLPTLSRVMVALTVMRGGIPALERMEELSGLLADASTTAADVEPQTFSSHVALQDVTLTYGSQHALDRVSLRIERGERIALLGPSGAGKTSLVDVLLGLQTPDSGTVVIDGQPFTNERRQGWRRLVAYVPQDTFIIDDTLRNNIRLGAHIDDVGDERLWAAISGAGLDDLVESLPDGLDSRLGDRGQLLSGGQRQRVGLARALYRTAALIVMDEATSALDNETQHLVTETVASLPDDVTVVLIAHRLNATTGCDRAVVLEAGRIVRDGDRDHVLEDSSLVAMLAESGSTPPVAG